MALVARTATTARSNKQKDARFETDVGKLNPLLTVRRLIEIASAEFSNSNAEHVRKKRFGRQPQP